MCLGLNWTNVTRPRVTLLEFVVEYLIICDNFDFFKLLFQIGFQRTNGKEKLINNEKNHLNRVECNVYKYPLVEIYRSCSIVFLIVNFS